MDALTWSTESSIFAAVASSALAKLVFGAITYVSRRQRMQHVGTVTELRCYPIKSCGGFSIKTALCTPLGLKDGLFLDRHWVVVRSNGDFVTQRQLPRMALIQTSVKQQGPELVLTAPGMSALHVPLATRTDRSKVMKCRVWDNRLLAVDCGEEASSWLSKYLQEPGLRLLYSAPDMPRVDITKKKKPWGNPAQYGDQAAFTDYCSYLMATEESLEDLNERLQDPVPMATFRPNIVIQGSPAFDEDTWDEVQIGETAIFRMLDPCTRCNLTTVDQSKGERNSNAEPLTTLRKFRCFRKYGESPIFGVNATLDIPAVIRIGDPVFAIRK